MKEIKMKRVLIIDSLNLMIRNYLVNPSLSTNGDPIGGIVGTFKSLQKLVRETGPDEIIFCWDGPNGSKKRKTIDSNYKAGRKPIRLNRAVHNLTDNEEMQNKVWQQTRIIEYLNNMPIIQTMLPEIEADDVISYVTSMPVYKGWQKIIVSNDKDFMQLCDKETVLLRPVKNEILNTSRILEQIGIHPNNMALARSIIGDASDNLPGIKGAGFATVAKRLGFLSSEEFYTIDKVVDYCSKASSRLKFFNNVVEHRGVIEHNYKMMQLSSPQMSIQAKQVVDHSIENFACDFNQIEILKMMREDGFGELNWEELKSSLYRISIDCKKNQDSA
tara:strand:+ start:6894 stop:7886 length:993 start_codon:yes stop_codon:yes gene_type:complete